MLFSGYRGRPDLTAAAMDGAWFVTSDLGLIGADGRLAVRGRADDVIVTGGEKVVAARSRPCSRPVPGSGRPPWWARRTPNGVNGSLR